MLTLERGADLLGGRPLFKGRESDGAAAEVVENGQDCSIAKGSQGKHIPAELGTMDRSVCQTWWA